MNPWLIEDNKVDFISDSLKCAMRRGPLGAWCGYVAITKTHPWFGKSHSDKIKPTKDMLGPRDVLDHGPIDLFCAMLSSDDVNEQLSISLAIRIHGGLTFSGNDYPINDSNLWWFGFDCCHAGDLIPGLDFQWREGVYRTQSYVVAECQSLASQLVSIENRQQP